jgi:hypothetical protein
MIQHGRQSIDHSFAFSAMPRLIFGPGVIGRIGEIAASFGKSALLVTGSEALERSGNLSHILGGGEIGRHARTSMPHCRRAVPRHGGSDGNGFEG